MNQGQGIDHHSAWFIQKLAHCDSTMTICLPNFVELPKLQQDITCTIKYIVLPSVKKSIFLIKFPFQKIDTKMYKKSVLSCLLDS